MAIAMADEHAKRIYRGLWRILADWFRVPEAPPTAIGSRSESMRPDAGFLRRLRFLFWIVLFATDLVFLALWIGSFFIAWWVGVLLFPVFVLVAIVPDIVAWIAMHLRYDTTWYVLSDRGMRIRRGIWVITETTITYENIQNVRVTQGPLQRHCGIASLVVQTAGGGGGGGGRHEGGPGLGAHVGLLEGLADAAAVRDRVMARVRASKSAGLGDETEAHPRWGTAHVAALREIRDALRARA